MPNYSSEWAEKMLSFFLNEIDFPFPLYTKKNLDDDICKDYLEVVDLELNRVLFSSCKESKKPIEVISISNQLEVSGTVLEKIVPKTF